MDNQHKKIKGYRDLSQGDIDLMNSFKEVEKEFAEFWLSALGKEGIDIRCLAIARTKMQEACMWACRAVAQPEDPYETGDPNSDSS